jgi:hypothetical protein
MYYYRLNESFLIVKLSFISIWILAIPVVNACWGPSSTNLGGKKPYTYYFIAIVSNQALNAFNYFINNLSKLIQHLFRYFGELISLYFYLIHLI